jgi:glycosyltransferase involved in cell wall biosynthesis
MNLLVALDHCFDRTPDGTLWSWFFSRAFWDRYLDVFDSVRVLARVRDVVEVSKIARKSNGHRVEFVPVPFYHGPWQYLMRQRAVHKAIRSAVRRDEAVILRSGQVGNCLAGILRKNGHPYGMEVIGDPYDAFAPGANKHILRPFFRWWYPRQIRRLCSEAAAVAYVTRKALQRRYPAGPRAISKGFSDIELPDEWFVETPRNPEGTARNILTVGTMDQPYKGHDVLIKALAAAVKRGADIKLAIAGDGRYRPALESLAGHLGVAARVQFLGQVAAGQSIRNQLDRADLFVLPSRTEGLPRALIEAMARALPCLASSVGGIPELLAQEDLFPPGDVVALAGQVCSAVGDVFRLRRMSARNLLKAREYRLDVLRTCRREFYFQLKEITQKWI